MASFIALFPALLISIGAASPDSGDMSGARDIMEISNIHSTHVAFADPPKKRHSITVPIPAPTKGVTLPEIYGPDDPARPLVVIDPGHGGHDPGAINRQKNYREKDLTLALAKALKSRLVAGGRVRVALTREDDRYLILQERSDIARMMGADLFISIHADAAESPQAHGATVYTLSETASDREAARLAARENKADVINGVNIGQQDDTVSSILIDLSQRESMERSNDFVRLLYREASPYVRFRSTWHRFASLVVLKAPDMPSILFEAGYITSARDADILGKRAGRTKIAEGLARAIEIYFIRQSASEL